MPRHQELRDQARRRAFETGLELCRVLFPMQNATQVIDLLGDYLHPAQVESGTKLMVPILSAVLENDFAGFQSLITGTDMIPQEELSDVEAESWHEWYLTSLAEVAMLSETVYLQSHPTAVYAPQRLLLGVMCICSGCWDSARAGLMSAQEVVLTVCRHRYSAASIATILARLAYQTFCLSGPKSIPASLVWLLCINHALDIQVEPSSLVAERYNVMDDRLEVSELAPLFLEESSAPDWFHVSYQRLLMQFEKTAEAEIRQRTSSVYEALM